MQFDHQEVELPKIKQKNKALPDGGRAYETPEGKLYPSITTVLSIRNKKQLFEGLNQFHKAAKFCLSDKPTKRQKRNDYED